MNETLIHDIVASCLQELENGETVEAVLALYPAHATELYPILVAAREAQKTAAVEPSREAFMRGRARLMQRATELRGVQNSAPRKRTIPFFQRLAVSFTVAAIFVLSGTGLVKASSSALPGESLYPVKRRWEDIRLLFAFTPEIRKSIEIELRTEREHEASELLLEGEEFEIELSGVLKNVDGKTYISTIPVNFPDGAQIPADGTIIEVEGHTTDQGYVEIKKFETTDDNEKENIDETPQPDTQDSQSENPDDESQDEQEQEHEEEGD